MNFLSKSLFITIVFIFSSVSQAIAPAAVPVAVFGGRVLLQLTTNMARNEKLIIAANKLVAALPQAQQAAAAALVRRTITRGLATGLVAFNAHTSFAGSNFINANNYSYFQTYNGANGLYNSSLSSGAFGESIGSGGTYSLGSASFGNSGSGSGGCGGSKFCFATKED